MGRKFSSSRYPAFSPFFPLARNWTIGNRLDVGRERESEQAGRMDGEEREEGVSD